MMIALKWSVLMFACIVCGCGPMDPAFSHKVYLAESSEMHSQIRMRLLFIGHEYKKPLVLRIYDDRGETWEVWIQSDNPDEWTVRAMPLNGKEYEIPLKRIYDGAKDPALIQPSGPWPNRIVAGK